MRPIIKVENLSKQYRIGARRALYGTLRESLSEAVSTPFRRLRRNGNSASEETIWALKDVSFDVMPGEVLGIIGRNGAGKSTLLKVLSQITEPTAGGVDIYGRVGSLLEVGTGFHLELTGRENIFLNGAILGMRRAEIERKFGEMVAFAEIERFLDMPVKHYSSGMYMRLAFAVAAHLDPEILLVDEVLAVGDVAFQKKCLGKMGEVAKEGRTVLFVSHNMQAVRSLCQRAIWLEQGTVRGDGEVSQVVAAYLNNSATGLAEQRWDTPSEAPGNEAVRLHAVRVLTEDSADGFQLSTETPLRIEVAYWNLNPNTKLNLSMEVNNQEGVCVFVTTTATERNWHGQPFPVGLFRSVCRIPGGLLNNGVHLISLRLVKDSAIVLHHEQDVIAFEVQDSLEMRDGWYGKWIGAVRPRLEWQTDLLVPGVENDGEMSVDHRPSVS